MFSKKIYIDILRVRGHVLDKAYNNDIEVLPSWNGIHAGNYLRKKKVKKYIEDIIKNIVKADVHKIELKDRCREAVIFINENENHFEVLDRIYKNNLSGHYIGKHFI